jgi:hypothetical protein
VKEQQLSDAEIKDRMDGAMSSRGNSTERANELHGNDHDVAQRPNQPVILVNPPAKLDFQEKEARGKNG